MGAKVVVLKGSPRKAGNSATLADQVTAGAESVDAQVESFYLHGMDIQPCDACDSCQGTEDIDCVIEDDMHILYPKLREADAVLFASPVYWFTITAQLKLVIDRFYGLTADIDEPENHVFAGKRIGIVLTYGGDDPYDSGAINAIRMFQDTFNYVPAEIVDIVYGYASDPGEIKANEDVMERAFELGTRLGAA
jgi:multimeric flavodoxin WrbA